jgi:hypothetical protein
MQRQEKSDEFIAKAIHRGLDVSSELVLLPGNIRAGTIGGC